MDGIGIRCRLRGLLAVLVPERLVLLDRADVLAVLLECGLVGGSARRLGCGVTLEDALDGLVGRLREAQHLLACPLDLLSAMVPRTVREAVESLLAGAAEAGEDLAREPLGVRTDLADPREQTGGLA